MNDFLRVNRDNWDGRVPIHVASPDYAFERYVNDATALSGVVAFDLPRLGDIRNCRGIHLQCHIGTDTISLARLGARMTGLDFSAPALTAARSLAERTGVTVDFVESDVYSAFDVVPREAFDLVYTGIGALCWLPSIDRWAQIVAGLLRPGGRLFIRDTHPMMFSLSDVGDGPLVVNLPYFETDEPVIDSVEYTYVAGGRPIPSPTTHEWNHGLGEIVGALLAHGLVIEALLEHDSVPWEAFPGRMERSENGEWHLTEHRERVPMSFTLQARRPPR